MHDICVCMYVIVYKMIFIYLNKYTFGICIYIYNWFVVLKMEPRTPE